MCVYAGVIVKTNEICNQILSIAVSEWLPSFEVLSERGVYILAEHKIIFFPLR